MNFAGSTRRIFCRPKILNYVVFYYFRRGSLLERSPIGIRLSSAKQKNKIETLFNKVPFLYENNKITKQKLTLKYALDKKAI